MALIKTITVSNNFGESSTFADAYIKVDQILGNRVAMTATLLVYKTQGGRLLLSRSVEFIPDMASNRNFIVQAYDAAKLLPEFSGAADV